MSFGKYEPSRVHAACPSLVNHLGLVGCHRPHRVRIAFASRSHRVRIAASRASYKSKSASSGSATSSALMPSGTARGRTCGRACVCVKLGTCAGCDAGATSCSSGPGRTCSFDIQLIRDRNLDSSVSAHLALERRALASANLMCARKQMHIAPPPSSGVLSRVLLAGVNGDGKFPCREKERQTDRGGFFRGLTQCAR